MKGPSIWIHLENIVLTCNYVQPMELWTGKQLFSVLVRPNAKTRVYVNLVVHENNYNKKANLGSMCPTDGYVYFRNSELICGQLGKATLGLPNLPLILFQYSFGFVFKLQDNLFVVQ